MKVSKTYGQYLYVSVLDFKDRKEQEMIYKKIKKLIEEWNMTEMVTWCSFTERKGLFASSVIYGIG